MTTITDDMVLQILDGLRNDVAAVHGETRARLDKTATRLTCLERTMADIDVFSRDMGSQTTSTRATLANLTARIERIQHHLGLDVEQTDG